MLPSEERSKHTRQFDQSNKLLVSCRLVTGGLMSLDGDFGHKDQSAGHTVCQKGQQAAGVAGGLALCLPPNHSSQDLSHTATETQSPQQQGQLGTNTGTSRRVRPVQQPTIRGMEEGPSARTQDLV